MSVNIALLTVTDTRTLETDKSGNILVDKIKKAAMHYWTEHKKVVIAVAVVIVIAIVL